MRARRSSGSRHLWAVRTLRRALEGLHECIGLITALTPLEAAVAEAIEDLRGREAQLVKREQRAAAVDRALTDLAATL